MRRQITATIEVGAYEQTDERDEAGDYIEGYVSRKVGVYAIAPSSSEEPGDRNRAAVITEWDIYAPTGTDISAHDVIRLPGTDDDHAVIGEAADWDNNPYGTPLGDLGVVVKVRKVDG